MKQGYRPGEWVEESERDTRWYLWTPLFRCRVSNIQTMSADYIRHFGMPYTGVEEYDRQTANEMVHRMLTINDMVEFFKQGTTVEVCNPADTKTIYESISNHLNVWKRELETGFHLKNAPLDELQLLDKFAHVVYEHAQWHFDKPFVDSLFARQMGGIVTVSRDQILTKKPKALQQEAVVPPVDVPVVGRVSMGEVFASVEAAKKSKWDRY